MKSPVPPLKVALEQSTREALEAAAAMLFDPNGVKHALLRAAGEGYDTCTLAPEKPLDLSQTPAAQVIVDRLTKEGLETEWARRTTPDGKTAVDLVVRWGTRRIEPVS